MLAGRARGSRWIWIHPIDKKALNANDKIGLF